MSPTPPVRRPRIAIAGIAIESSTFSPHRAGLRDFHVVTGDDLLARYDALAPGGALADRADWLPVVYARSIPGGPVLPEVYADLRQRILDGLAALVADGPLDGVFLDIHGAMSVVGADDAEGDLVTAVREVVGDTPVLSAAMDLHGNVSRTLITRTDLLTCFRMAPHEDAWDTRERAMRNLVTVLARGERPLQAWVRVPILLPGEKTSTRVEPARGLYGRLPEVEARPGVLDAAIWVGYAWADEPRCHATVVVSGWDRDEITAQARSLAEHLWDVRDDFTFVGPPGTLDEAVDAALAATERPYLISDSGDNPGAGGTGDVTWTLARLLDRPELTGPDAPTTLCASVFDAEALTVLAAHQVGDTVTVTAGARVDSGPHGPVTLTGRLVHLSEGDPDAGRVAVVAVGGLHVVLTQHRQAYHTVTAFERAGLDPRTADIVVTKIGYLEPELYAIARGWTLALTPGGVDQDLARLGHHRIDRPMYPFDTFDTAPDLTPVVL
ncbi:M81 family metallopeptidase [Cellulomonas triticagri]|uniref:M81 family peptidase n=1 Tax=Cellulomonas triticagri TaxID=2483352 RepID=A0A3M2JLK5_9CELL|nr:M81 family metallopeptidase [Cellulomonas triticagri]RMI12700.1 M81 family peptidase [Cellulomonas triticagri]